MDTKNRRQFLKNTSLTALSLGLLSTGNAANTKEVVQPSSLMCDKTTNDFYGEGPFYTENPPTIETAKLATDAETGIRIIISGRVANLDCSQVIPNAIIDVWHANDKGEYDNTGGYNLRGKFLTNSQGFYIFETIMPGKYKDGDEFRPAHIHFKITPPGFEILTTQLYFSGDPDLARDPASSITSGEFDATHRIISLTENAAGKMEGTWDISIQGNGVTTSTNDIHLNKGIIYKVSPNPFSDRVVVRYGVFKKAQISLLVYDINGRLVANLEERVLPPEKYDAVWSPAANLPNGHYFIALKVNDLQVHYLKIIRQR